MQNIPVQDAANHLAQIIRNLQPGEVVVLTENGEALAKLVRTERQSWPCKAGSAKDTAHWMAPDFNAPLEEFKEYME
jgi:antitoxin (DNA-binding transcriptional repressor) of toxin-antitoxin stability system